MIRKALLAITLVVILAGCAALSRPPEPLSRAAVPAVPILDRHKTVFVAMPEDGSSGSLWYVGSGRLVTHAVANAFSRQGIRVCISERRVKHEDVVAAAMLMNAGYAVRPTITRWDQRNEWLGCPGRLSVGLSIIDVASARVVSSASVNGFSHLAPATLPTPDELLAGPLSQYLNALY